MYSQTVNFSDTTWEKLGDVRDSALVTPTQYESGPTGRTMTRIAALGGVSARPATVNRRGAFDRARAPGATGLGRPSWLARENLKRAPNRGNTRRVVVRGPLAPKSTAVDQLSGTPAPPPVTDRPPGPQRVKLHRLSKTADLPNGMTVHYISPPDVQFLYGEIFEEHCYVRNGITLHTDDVVIDVGGNIGLFAMYAAKKCVCGKVFTLEPIPSTYRAMVRNLCENLSPRSDGSCEPEAVVARTPASVAIGNRGNNSMDDADFGDVFGRQLPSRDYPDANAWWDPDASGIDQDGGECVFLENDIDGFQSDGGVMSCGNQAGAVWAYNCGVGDGRQHAGRFTFYPRAAGWSTMVPDDLETSANVRKFVESALGNANARTRTKSSGKGRVTEDDAVAGSKLARGNPLAAFGGWLLSLTETPRESDQSSSQGGLLNLILAPIRYAAKALFQFILGAVLKFMLGNKYEFECPLVTVSDVVDSHELDRIDLLKVDVERAELAVLRGVRSEHWSKVRQVAMEVHDSAGGTKELEECRRLLVDVGKFEEGRIVAEQPDDLEGSTLWNLYASRA